MGIKYNVVKYYEPDGQLTQGSLVCYKDAVEEALSLADELNGGNTNPYVHFSVLVTRNT